jgi:DNA processing protein
MTHDHAVALTLVPGLSRLGLVERLRAGDPALAELADAHVQEAVKLRGASASRGIRTIAWNEPDYPPALLTLVDAPPALWYRGRLDCVDRPAVAVVGARRAMRASLEVAHQLAADLAARGVTVVSGLARGVDSAAHRGALTRGRTAAVLGGDPLSVYPPEHATLADDIAACGVVLSEYPPGTPPLPYHFPMRNRLISGLARAVVVVEAAEKSGSLITAGCALDQGREVMVVPGSVQYGRNKGGHGLIRDGAKIVETADDIVGELRFVAPLVEGRPDELSDAEPGGCGSKVLMAMEPGEAYDVEELVARTGASGSDVLRALTDLELDGRVRRTASGGCIRVS